MKEDEVVELIHIFVDVLLAMPNVDQRLVNALREAQQHHKLMNLYLRLKYVQGVASALQKERPYDVAVS